MLKIFRQNIFLIIYSLLLCVINFTPVMKLMLPNIGIAAIWGGFVVCFMTTILSTKDKTLNKIRNYWVVFLVIFATYYILGISKGSINNLLPNIIYIIPLFVYIVLDKKCDDTQLYALFHVFCLIVSLNIADSVRLCIMYPMEVTYQSMAEELGMVDVAKLNLGGASFLNMSVLYLNVVLIAFFRAKKKGDKIAFGIYTVITLIFDVFFSLKASVILIAILSVLLQYIAHHTTNYRKSVSWVIVLFIIFFAFRDIFIQTIVSAIGSDRVAIRLLALTSDGGQEGDITTLTERSNLWLVSLQTWISSFKNFLVGIGERALVEGQSAAVTGIGNHSDICDTLARYGLMGGLIIYSAFANLYRYFKSLSKVNISAVISFFLILIIMAFSKKILLSEIGFVLFCLLPLCFKLYNPKR